MSHKVAAIAAACLFLAIQMQGATYVVPPDDVFIEKAGAIVVGRALTSYVQESPDRGIETVTVLSVERVLKGGLRLDTTVEVHVIGGVLEDRAKIVPGAPRFKDGEEVLVFLNQLPDGTSYTTTDFGLGLFSFDTDETGRRVLLRTAGDLHGWNTDGTTFREGRRDADLFLEFIRDRVRHIPTAADYVVEEKGLIGNETFTERMLRPVSNAFSVTQYTMGNTEADPGFRWKVFPTAVNWNKGNDATNSSNNGTDAINSALAAWNGDTNSNTNYVLATSNANANGINEAADGINNIVFEKAIASPYVCASGGVLGLGGISNASVDGTNLVNGEQFYRTTEADVSMNQGVNACIGGTLSTGNFLSALTHEIGHTLGLRHSDKRRDNSNTCVSVGTYDCSSSAIMTAVITNGLNGALQTWDHSAVAALYPGAGVAAPSAPTNVVATATSSSSVSITWTAVGTATSYEVRRRAPGGSYTLVGSPASASYTDNTVSANTAYMYVVRAVNSGGSSADSSADLATTVVYTDDALVAGTTTIKATHLTELRTAVNTVRAQAGLATGSYTDALPSGISVKAVHITEMRTQLDAAMLLLGLTTGGFTDASLSGASIKATHFQELRNRMK